MDFRILITPIVGGVIGYTTNWLALKMLFRPHKPYYIGKIRLPFTPGLIPRERERIAQGLGDAVGKELLTEEVLIKELANERIVDAIHKELRSHVLDKEWSLDELISLVYPDRFQKEKLYETIADRISIYAVEQTSQESLEPKLKLWMMQVIDSHDTIEELLSQEAILKIRLLLMEKKGKICESICETLEEEAIATKIQDLIQQYLADKLGGLAAMFMNPEHLYQGFLTAIKTYLSVEENQDMLIELLYQKVEEFSQSQIGDVLDENQKEGIVDEVARVLSGRVSDSLTGPAVNAWILKLIKKLSCYQYQLSEEAKVTVLNRLEEIYRHFLKEKLPAILKSFNVASVVEKEINGFSIERVEGLIFKIADKELKAITWLGALLGFILGCLTLLF